MGQNKYIPPYKPVTFEAKCPNDGPSYFDTEYENSFYAKCHLCDWMEVNPDYKAAITDLEMLTVIRDRWEANTKNKRENPEWYLDSVYIDTPDKTLCDKYTQEEIFAKLEELDYRHLIEYGVSLRTAWITQEGLQCLDNLYEESAKR